MGNSTTIKYQRQIPELTTLVDKLECGGNKSAKIKASNKIVAMYNRSYTKKTQVEHRLCELQSAFAYGVGRHADFSGATFAYEKEQVVESDVSLQYEIACAIRGFEGKLKIIDDNMEKLLSLYRRLNSSAR